MTPLAEFRDVHFRYPHGARGAASAFALEGVSFAMASGEVLGVIGPNSAGKTTLIRLLTGVLAPAAGEVRVEGVPLARLDRFRLARCVAVVAQDVPAGLPFTVEEVVLLGRYPHGPRRFFDRDDDRAAARRAMAQTGVLGLAASPVERLSGGERQRVMLARALAQEPRLLVLDEPTAHLDLRYQVECVRLIRDINRRHGTGVLLVSHDLNLASAVADRLLLLHAGRVARLGPPDAVLDAAVLCEVYGCPVRVHRGQAPGRPGVEVEWPQAGEGEASAQADDRKGVRIPNHR